MDNSSASPERKVVGDAIQSVKKREPVSPRGAKGRLVIPSRVAKLSKKQKERNRKLAGITKL